MMTYKMFSMLVNQMLINGSFSIMDTHSKKEEQHFMPNLQMEKFNIYKIIE